MASAPTTGTATSRVAAVLRAVEATLTGDSSVVGELFCPEVHATIPAPAWSATTLAVEIEDRRGAFAQVHVRANHHRSVDDETWVEWAASALHVGPVAVDDTPIPPTGRHVEIYGITIAEFRGGRIAAFRQYWDCSALTSGAAAD